MRLSPVSPRAPLASVISVVALVAAVGSVSAEELDLNMGGLVGELAIVADLEPSVAVEVEAATSRKSGGKVALRQAVPSRDRAETFRSSEIFRNSRVALPLLVADLEPRMTVARPMSGRSVGARPVVSQPDLPVDRIPSQTVPPRDSSRW